MKKAIICKVCISILAAAVIYILGSFWISTNLLTLREYEFETEKTEQDVKMVLLSDLHDHEFGAYNEKLVRKVREQKPDLILLDGDFLNETSLNANIPCELIAGLVKIAPVCFSLGNHEEAYMKNDHPELIPQLEKAGAIVLEKEYIDLNIRGTDLRLGGMYDYAFGMGGNNDASAASEETKKFLEEFQNTEHLKIMMAHRPDSFIFGDASSYWDVDLVVSGHDHGGQVVLPFLGGLYGGDQGWFPEYIHGMYQKDEMKLFITSGLGSHKQTLPRFNNPPEIAVVRILHKSKSLSVARYACVF